ncbi:ATP-dependent RNA helicase rhlE [uncultured Clostridium sp.]|uniref:DEAD/DEAH box helicase n=1 Tax=Intestinimonas butyriciproducens TaxID=1297617 RepID=UPI000821F441|nr:DEAD/DEAH box helicase [Intestinimonas butyriciproducens]MBU5228868.1 DEAD/DEAH box helicase [Intestinimonas butyriciproducens]MDB7861226.1 DEAD/DEAH box helicase [Intestinimonas butyriciproducens]MDB7864078.1 DEAD/DEAH box helicase [Intestinimonas butyriciproducens]SCJ45024.1 ATP-dependent RNA helicase rhlE [uncultured Clostridium sp.]
MNFKDLGLIAPILRALDAQGYAEPTPIQAGAIPPALLGRDVLGCAQTGTGKTCAFATPILQRLNADVVVGPRYIRSLILTPTRELALQIQENFEAYGRNLPLRSAVIFGGVGQQPQVDKIKRGLDILVATPGRLLDLQGQGLLDLSRVEIFVLDEADRMLDMGFIHDVRRVLKLLPPKKQTLFFSATMPPEVMDLVNGLLHDPARVAVDPVSSPVEVIDQKLCFVDKSNKSKLLSHLIREMRVKNALVFTRTKHGANKVAGDLMKAGISAAAIHGNKSQTARQQALSDFKAGRTQVLVATDIAARGIDIEELSHVFNYNLSEVPETYVHRIGRTGRAGHGGCAVSFCDFAEKEYLRGIEKLIGQKIPVVEEHPWPMEVFEAPRDAKGRAVNADDAEARAAAKERRRARDTAAKAAAEEEQRRGAEPAKSPAAKPQKVQAVPVSAPKGEGGRKRRAPRWQKAEGELSHKLDAVLPERTAGTSEAGYEDFRRPDPLGSDRIMDATARLLSPRSVPAQKGRVQAPQERVGKKHRRKKSSSAQSVSPAPRPREEKASAPAPAPKKRQDHGRGHRGGPAPLPMKSGAVKDSTEQPSLMKPYYIEHD